MAWRKTFLWESAFLGGFCCPLSSVFVVLLLRVSLRWIGLGKSKETHHFGGPPQLRKDLGPGNPGLPAERVRC